MNKFVKCPTCKKEIEWSSASHFRPFCSERCRLIDLGDWASEKHTIADESSLPAEDLSLYLDEPDSN